MTKAGIALKQIASAIQHANPEQLFTMQDIYNIGRKFRIEQLGGCTPIKVILYEL